jgi:hypothetical protein
MKTSTKKTPKRNFDYPNDTKGGKIALKIRKEANTLSEPQREALFKAGMQIVYGGTCTKETICVRR